MEQRLREAASVARAHGPVPRLTLFDIGYPQTPQEYANLGGMAVLAMTSVTHDKAELPLKNVRIVVHGRSYPLKRFESELSSMEYSYSPVVKTFGPYREDALYFLPVKLRAKTSALMFDFSAGQADAKFEFRPLPDDIRKLVRSEMEAPPTEQAVEDFVRQQFPGYFDLNGPAAQEEAHPVLPLDAYPIYDAVVKAYAGREEAKTVSIVRFTKLDNWGDCRLGDAFDTDAWKEAVADLRRRNEKSFVLESKLRVPVTIELADAMEQVGGTELPPPGESELEVLRKRTARLDQMIRDHNVQIRLSAPGVSRDGRVAVVFLAVSFAGEFFALRKEEGEWKVERVPACSWIS
jgi:hypothetical protein